jgi:hypothetical protein
MNINLDVMVALLRKRSGASHRAPLEAQRIARFINVPQHR